MIVCKAWRTKGRTMGRTTTKQYAPSTSSKLGIQNKTTRPPTFELGFSSFRVSCNVYYMYIVIRDFFFFSFFSCNVKICVKYLFNLYHSLGIFSRRQIDDIFLIFPRKQDLTFLANCLLRRQFAWNVISCFLRKIRKIFQNVVCWKFYPEC